MSEVENFVEAVEEVGAEVEAVAKVKRGYRSKFFYMTAEEVKEHKQAKRALNNKKYKENHYDKIREAQARYFAKESTKDYMRDYKRKEVQKKKEMQEQVQP